MKVIAVAGKLNSGKGTLAEVFSHEGNFAPMAFADPMKLILQDLFNFSHLELWGPSEHRSPRTREILQAFGTDFARKYDPEVWVDYMDRRIKAYEQSGVDKCFPHEPRRTTPQGIVITDLRFPNEAQMLRREYGATIIKIVRPHSDDAALPEHNRHESETAVATIPNEDIRYVVYNTGSREDLLDEAHRLMELVCSL
jgi:hypothetical protein